FVAPPKRDVAWALIPDINFLNGTPSLGRLGECYDRTYSGIPAQPPQRGPGHRALPRGRPRSRARQLPDLCEGAAGQPRVLRGEGKPVAGSAVAAGPDGLVLRHRNGGRNRNGAGCRCDGGPHLLWQYDQ